jgi:CubicO group peptidase (beta-lactamase class C family)
MKFDAAIETLAKENLLPGLSIAIVENGSLQHRYNYGYADSNRTVPITSDTPFWVASVTKPFVALAFLHLESEKKIDLDERAADTPNFVKLCEWLSSTTIPFGKNLRCDAPITIRHILHHQVNGKPGSAFLYNPIMYSRLSRYLEHRFGNGIDHVEGRHNFLGQTIDRVILEPADMTRTVSSMWDRTKMDVYFDLADGFKVNKHRRKVKMRRPDKHIAGGAGLVSTTNDLAKFESALHSGSVTPGDIPTKILSPAQLSDGSVSDYGFGWYFQCLEGERLMWHAGWDDEAGYSAIYLRFPERGLAFIALANGEGLWWGNPLDKAMIEKSKFAQLLMKHFLDTRTPLESPTQSCAN